MFSSKALKDLLLEIMVILLAMRVVHSRQFPRMEAFRYSKPLMEWFFSIYFLFTEACITILFLVVGVCYILIKNGPSNVIQAALSLIFISEIDDKMFKLLFSSFSSSEHPSDKEARLCFQKGDVHFEVIFLSTH